MDDERKPNPPEPIEWSRAYDMFVFCSDRTPVVEPHKILPYDMCDLVARRVYAVRALDAESGEGKS